MKKFCGSLREYKKIELILRRKKMLWLIIKQSKLQQDATECYISRKRFMKKFVKYKNDQQVRDYCHS